LQIFRELQRRNVVRVTIGYIVSSWLLAQVADLVLENIGAPDWVMQTILLLLVLGFPVVVFFSWAYEVTPEGIKRESEIDRSQSITHITARKLDRAIMATLLVAVGYFAYDKFILSDAPDTAIEPVAQSAEGVAASTSQQSIAVLPFVNMSDDASNEYFSEGLSEELLNLLAKNPKLRVAARTSSFSFKGRQVDISDIASQLNVAHVLEGSVRRAGDQVRVTAQLIKADDGFHLWSETYDRQLDNIFAIQDEIAGAISSALLSQIIGKDADDSGGDNTATSQYNPPAANYQSYLLARNQFNKQSVTGLERALEILEPLVRGNPDYAEAQALYANVVLNLSRRAGIGDMPWITAQARIRNALGKALSLNPNLAEAHLVEARTLMQVRDVAGTISALEKAIELNPSYSAAYVSLAEITMAAGQQERAWQALEKARALDPLSPDTLNMTAHMATLYDRPDTAGEALAALEDIEPESASLLRVHLYMDLNEVAKAIIALEQYDAKFEEPGASGRYLADLYVQIGMLDEAGSISPRQKLFNAAVTSDRALALELLESEVANITDPHDRADVYWMIYYLLGMYDEALTVLSDLWYGYAEEQIGPKMGTFDVGVFANLLALAGRNQEAATVIEQQREFGLINFHWVGKAFIEARLLLAEGRLDDAFQIMEGLADKGFIDRSDGKNYAFFPGLDQHPDFPRLAAKAEAWREQQYDLYQSLKQQP
jgi:TolB-like protein/Tfp pilus assembly protein PilF